MMLLSERKSVFHDRRDREECYATDRDTCRDNILPPIRSSFLCYHAHLLFGFLLIPYQIHAAAYTRLAPFHVHTIRYERNTAFSAGIQCSYAEPGERRKHVLMRVAVGVVAAA